MDPNPFISVVIATCDRPELALRTVRSVLAQTYDNFEVIVVNNGSTADAVRKYNELFAELNIHYLDVNNQYSVGLGPAKARNLGISVARGDYIAFCDDDDMWINAEYLTNIARILTEQKPDIAFANQKSCLVDGTPDRSTWFDASLCREFGKRLSSQCYRVDISYFYKYGGFPHLNTTVYSTEYLHKHGVFLESLSYEEDFELFIRLGCQSKNICYLDQLVSQHYVPDKKKQVNVSSKYSELDIQAIRIGIFSRLSTISDNRALTQFLAKQSCYALTKLTLAMIKQNNYFRAKSYLRQALGCQFKVKLLGLYAYIFAKQLRCSLKLKKGIDVKV